jgi:hypothetical protein
MVNATGKIGKAITCSGTNKATVPYAAGQENDNHLITVSVWFKLATDPTTWPDDGVLVDKLNVYRVGIQNDGTIFFRITDGSFNYPTAITTTKYSSTSTWYHVVCTCGLAGATALKIYVNDVEATYFYRDALADDMAYDISTDIVFGNTAAASKPFVGSEDEIRIWFRAFVQAGVDSLYAKENAGTSYPW